MLWEVMALGDWGRKMAMSSMPSNAIEKDYLKGHFSIERKDEWEKKERSMATEEAKWVIDTF